MVGAQRHEPMAAGVQAPASPGTEGELGYPQALAAVRSRRSLLFSSGPDWPGPVSVSGQASVSCWKRGCAVFSPLVSGHSCHLCPLPGGGGVVAHQRLYPC